MKKGNVLLPEDIISPPFATGFRASHLDTPSMSQGIYKSFGNKLTECCKNLKIIYTYSKLGG
jgi:hypothetical protein